MSADTGQGDGSGASRVAEEAAEGAERGARRAGRELAGLGNAAEGEAPAVVALGFVAFGLFCFAEARARRI